MHLGTSLNYTVPGTYVCLLLISVWVAVLTISSTP